MQRFIAVCLLMIAGGTATAQISTDWSTVEALQPGTRILVQFPNGRRQTGLVEQIDDNDLTTIADNGRVAVLHRGDIASVSIREPAGRSRRERILKSAAIGAAAASVLAILGIAAHDENGQYGLLETEIVLGGAAAGAAIGSASKPKPVYHDRLIYVRQ